MISGDSESAATEIGPLWQDVESLWPSYAKRIGSPSPDNAPAVPDFLVCSPAKTGTTWLAKHLGSHPQVFIPAEKEVRYFDTHWRFHDVNWYLRKFAEAANQTKGEASPSYAWLPTSAIHRIRDLNPRLKLLFLARRLPERAWSHTRHCFRYRESTFRSCVCSFEALPKSEIVRSFLSDYALSASDYVGVIRRWLRFFPVSQFHVRYFEDAMAQPEDYLRDIFRFLGVSPEIDFGKADLQESINPGIPMPLPEWAEPVLADIYGWRQQDVETFLEDTFGLASPWRPLAPATATVPIWVQDRPDNWRIYFHQGLFHGLRINDAPLRPDELRGVLDRSREVPGILRSAFWGDLTFELDRRSGACSPSACDAEETRLVGVLLDLNQDYDLPYCETVKQHRGFSILRSKARFYGLRHTVGNVEVTMGDDLLDERYAREDVIAGQSESEVEARIDAIEAQRAVRDLTARLERLRDGPARNPAIPHLTASYRGFNLVDYEGRVYGLRQSLGHVDVTRGEEALHQSYGDEDLIIGESPSEIRTRIDAVELRRDAHSLDAHLGPGRS